MAWRCGGGLVSSSLGNPHGVGNVHAFVARQRRFGRVKGVVRTGEAAPQEERLGKVVRANSLHAPAPNAVVDKQGFVVRPHSRAQVIRPIGHVAVVGQRRSSKPELHQAQVVVVRVWAVVSLPIVLVFDDRAVAKTARQADGRGVHFADVDCVVAAVLELLDPVGLFGRQPRLVAVNAVGVDVLARNDAVARWTANGPLHKGATERHATGGQPINVRGADVVVAQAAERVPALLVGDHQDDIGRAIFCLVHASQRPFPIRVAARF